MSQRLFGDDVIFLQRLLKSSGLYTGKIDGIWGPKTDAAVSAFDAKFTEIATRLEVFHARTEANLRTLQPKAQELMRITLKTIIDAGINARIISGTRTYEEQNKLFAQGRFGNPGPIVTKARGGFSNHNFGIACDIGIFNANGAFLGESPLYAKAGSVTGEAHISNLEWGGNWTGFKDQPHFQFHSTLSISQLRDKFENGEPII